MNIPLYFTWLSLIENLASLIKINDWEAKVEDFMKRFPNKNLNKNLNFEKHFPMIYLQDETWN